MKLEVNIEKKYFFILLGAILIIGGIIGVIAFNPSGTGGNPAVMGHSADELQVNVSGTMMSLQQAITSGSLGGGIDWKNKCRRLEFVKASGTLQCNTDEFLVDAFCSDDGANPDCIIAGGIGGKLVDSDSQGYSSILCCK